MITKNVSGILCYSNKISKNIVDTLEESSDDMNLKITLRHIPFNNAEIMIPTKVHHVPRDYQLEAIEAISGNDNTSCILAMPCGTGKTYTVSILAKQYNNVIIISPLKKLTYDVLDNLSIFLGKDYKKTLISSDGIRDSGCTYDSSDILIDVVEHLEENDYLNKTLLIVDEFHNLSANNLTNPEDDLCKILNKHIKTVYLSATPNIGIEHDVIHRYKWEDAIRDEYICDFNITIPTPDVIDDENLQKMIELLENVGADVDEKMIKKGYFLIRSMLFNGDRKCIVYLTTLEKAKLFNKVIDGLLLLLNIECEVHVITNKTSKKNRDGSIYRFRNNDIRTILLNVHILDEGIDIPECDSIYVTQPNNNIDNLIQRMCRCNRRTTTKTKCNMYIWTTELKVTNLLKYIKNNTYDGIFSKIKRYSSGSNKIADKKKTGGKVGNKVGNKGVTKSVKVDNNDDLAGDEPDNDKNNNLSIVEKNTYKPRYQCATCKKAFKRQANLDYHMNNSVCTGTIMEIDLEQNENEKGYRCRYCNKVFTTSTSMYRHMKHTCKIKRKEDDEKKTINERLLILEEDNKIAKKIQDILKKKIANIDNNVRLK
jgi:superfamily II DNA or RNA helicase